MTKIIYLISGFIGLKIIESRDRKNAGEWGFLVSTLFIIPLLFWNNPGVVISVTLQLLWAITAVRAAFLARETWQKQKQNKRP